MAPTLRVVLVDTPRQNMMRMMTIQLWIDLALSSDGAWNGKPGRNHVTEGLHPLKRFDSYLTTVLTTVSPQWSLKIVAHCSSLSYS